MKKTKIVCLLLVIALLVAVPVIASATGEQIIASGTCGENVTWSVSDYGVLRIEGTGAIADFVSADAPKPWDGYTFYTVRIGSGVTRIGDYAFANSPQEFGNLEMAETVCSIGKGAFENCDGLSYFSVDFWTISLGEGMFRGCDGLQGMNLPLADNYIPDDFARDCPNLNRVNLPVNLVSIGNNAFDGCTSLEEVTFPETLQTIGEAAFRDCSIQAAVLPENISQLGASAFEGCSSLETVDLGKKLTVIADSTFAGCTALKGVNLPETVISIQANAFAGCTGIQRFVFGSALTSVDSKAFDGCEAINYLQFRGDAPVFAEDALSGLQTTAYYPQGNPTWTAAVRQNYGGTITWKDSSVLAQTVLYSGYDTGKVKEWKITADGTLTITSKGGNFLRDGIDQYKIHSELVTRIVVGPGIYVIPADAFSDMDNVTEVVLPDTVEDIHDSAFANMDSLQRIDIPAAVTKIRKGAFAYCSNLQEVVIPEDSQLVELENDVFRGCTSLRGHLFLPETLTRIGYRIFSDGPAFDSAKIYTSQYIDFSVSKEFYSVEYGGKAREMRTFRNCTNLTKAVLGGRLDFVPTEAFDGCTALTTVEFTDEIPTIGARAFKDCTALTEVTFPFGPPTLEENIFENVTATVYYPGNNLAWLDVITENYGGQITWLPYGDITEVVIDSGTIGTTQWQLTSHGKLTVSGSGPMTYDYRTVTEKYTNQILSVVIEEGITEIAHSLFWNCAKIGSVSLPESLTQLGNGVFRGCTSLTAIRIPEGVTELNSSMFSECVNLTTVELPDGMTTIWEHAFSGCTSLTEITLPSTLTSMQSQAFANCTSLRSIVLPKGLNRICNYMFENCTALESVICEGQINAIEFKAFQNCTGLNELRFTGDAPADIASDAFLWATAVCYYPADNGTWLPSVMQSYGGDVTWKSYGETDIVIVAQGTCGEDVNWTLDGNGTLRITGTGAMDDYFEIAPPWQTYMSKIKVIIIGDGVTHVGAYAFYECATATRAFFGKDIISIGEGAFAYSGVNGITLPETLTTIGEGAFAGCFALSDITIPKNVTEIAQYAFAQCDNLRGINVQWGNPAYSSYLGVLYNADKSVLVLCPAGMEDTVHCDDACWVIMPEAFAGCKKITQVQMAGVQMIGEGAFVGCTALETVSIGVNTTVIPAYAFAQCENLKTVEFSDTVAEIGLSAFSGCTGLESITFPAGLSAIGEKAFDGCTGLKNIFFTGQVPDIDDTAFTGVTAKATYPRNKQTWTTAVMKNYGGKLTWKKEPEPVVTMIDGGKCSSSVSWKFYDNGKLVISGTGAIPNYTKNEGAPWLAYAEMITELVVEQGVTGLGDWNFIAPNMVTAQMPASLKTISPSAFVDCRKLTGIHIAKDNKTYASQSGVLYNKAMTELIWCPGGYYGELTIASTTQTIRDSAFYNCQGITSVVIPASVTSIEDYAFMGCVGTLIFNGGNHSGLMEVYFEGDAPEFGQDVFYGMMATIHYPAGNPTWTEEARQNYGGKRVTWVAYTKGILGDVSGDGILDSFDATLILQYDVGMISGDGLQLSLADVSGDGIIDSFDATLILQYDVGMIPGFPGEAV